MFCCSRVLLCPGCESKHQKYKGEKKAQQYSRQQAVEIPKLALSQVSKSVQPHMQLYQVGLEAVESRVLLNDCSVNP